MKLVAKRIILSSILLSTIFPGCEPQLVDDPIPLVAFNDQVLNLSLPEYTNLRNPNNGWYELKRAGVRGIIVVNTNGSYKAYEKNCSFHPNEAGATVNVDASNLFMKDASCGSQFGFNGNPTAGPAWRPLRQYVVILDNNVLTVTDDIIE